MATRDPLVVFTPSGKRGHFPVGTPVLQAARSLGVDIDSVCGGRGLCGRCQVLVAEGEFAKHGVSSSSASLSPFSEPEMRFSRRVPLAEGRRLSCSARVEADVVIDVPASSQVHRQVVRKEADAHAIELNPVVRLHYVQVKQPDMHDPSGDLRRLFEALEAEWGLTGLTCDLSVIQTLQPTLRSGILGRSRWRCMPPSRSSGCGPACTNWSMDSRWTSVPRPLPRTSATWPAARSSPRRES